MIFELGDMWSVYGKTDLFCITANSTVKKNGALVMGRGIAKEVRDNIFGFDKLAGQAIFNHSHNKGKYGFLIVPRKMSVGQVVALFQVKIGWYEDASLDLIDWSCRRLSDYLKVNKVNRLDLNFPGIGNGNLLREQVLPILENNFKDENRLHIWEKNIDN